MTPPPDSVGTQPLAQKPVTVRSLSVELIEGVDFPRSVEAPEDRLTIGTGRSNHLVLSDPTVSRFHLELEAGSDGVWVRDLGSRNGTWVSDVAVERARVPIGTELRIGRSRLRILDGADRTVDTHRAPVLHGLLGGGGSMRRLMGTVRRVATTNLAVLVTGESGTGKELVARAVHAESDRKGCPFVVLDCAALTPNLVASALFGHERGAFTGADRRHIGAFERGSGGTVFLDEIGELPLDLQPQLLGVLERKRFLRLGSSQEIDVDVRVIAATNRDLRLEVNRGAFREDLYYRLSVVNIEMPPLRERPEDLPLLAEHFLRETGSTARFADIFTDKVLAQMARHDWPGNVRELRNFVEALVAMGEAPSSPRRSEGSADAFVFGNALLDMRYADARASVLTAFEREYLTRLLQTTKGNVSAAARSASMDRSYLIKLLEKHALK